MSKSTTLSVVNPFKSGFKENLIKLPGFQNCIILEFAFIKLCNIFILKKGPENDCVNMFVFLSFFCIYLLSRLKFDEACLEYNILKTFAILTLCQNFNPERK